MEKIGVNRHSVSCTLCQFKHIPIQTVEKARMMAKVMRMGRKAGARKKASGKMTGRVASTGKMISQQGRGIRRGSSSKSAYSSSSCAF